MKNFQRVLFTIAVILSFSANALKAGCTADDPGECYAACADGSPCCIGLSPNCKEDANGTWINCGDGAMMCGGNFINE